VNAFAGLGANARGAVWMVLGMFAYTANDTVLKLASDDFGLFQIVFFRSLFLVIGFTAIARHRNDLRPLSALADRPLLARILAELALTTIFMIALPVLAIGSITAIMQTVPLAITLAAALFLREAVGWRRWAAIVLGFVGVLLVVRPGSNDFSWYSLLMVVAVVLVVLRDLATRKVDQSLPSVFLALSTAVAVAVLGAVVSLAQGWMMPTITMMVAVTGSAMFLGLGYTCTILTMRTGDVSFTAPFRYAVMVFALAVDVVVFAKLPTVLTVVGCVFIVVAGLSSVVAERHATRHSPLPLATQGR